MAEKIPNLTIAGARMWFRNFAGKEGRFNPAGRRNFSILLETELAKKLEKDGWNVRWREPREEGDEPQAHISVAVNYDNRPPKIVLVTSNRKTLLDEGSVSLLDWADIIDVDLVINPYRWEVNGKVGVKAYLKSMYVTIEEDEFAEKYNDIPNAADCYTED